MGSSSPRAPAPADPRDVHIKHRQVGAILNNDGAGHARVWEWSTAGSAWTRRGADLDGEAYDLAGYSVAISEDGSVVAVGAILHDDGGVKNTGRVSVHEWDGASESWARRGDDIDGPTAGDESGYSVSLSADARYMAVGAPKSDKGGADAGEVRVFEWVDSAYAQRGRTIVGDAVLDRLGWAVSLSGDGDVLVCGMPHSDRGRARVLAWDGATRVSGVRPFGVGRRAIDARPGTPPGAATFSASR